MNKYFMTGPKLFRRDPSCLSGEAKPRKTLRSRGSKSHCLPRDQSLSVLLYSRLKTRKYCEEKSFALLRLAPANLPRFQRARPDHVRMESSCCCFPRELMNFVRHRELVGFDPQQVTRSSPIGKRI